MPKSTDDYAPISIEDTVRELQTDNRRGLSEEEARNRLTTHGYNEIPEKAESTLHRVFRRFRPA